MLTHVDLEFVVKKEFYTSFDVCKLTPKEILNVEALLSSVKGGGK